MTHPYFGKAMPIHFAALMLAGYDIDALAADCAVFPRRESERISIMRRGHDELVTMTGFDYSYDLAQWREFLVTCSEDFGYKHRYAFQVVDQAIQRAMSDPEFQRIAKLLSA
jgi:hypothetical protein